MTSLLSALVDRAGRVLFTKTTRIRSVWPIDPNHIPSARGLAELTPMRDLLQQLAAIVTRKDRFTFDLRGGCQVYTGIVAAYKTTRDSDHFTDLPLVIAHALEHDGIVGAWKDPRNGRTYYDSCRVFTDMDSALRFAQQQQQISVRNLNRDLEVPVGAGSLAT